ncbi:MAG: M24 family metallopeptidase [Paracoccus sp. (in: a-proteobacteria)]
MDERLARTIAAIDDSGADWALLTSPDAVAYASGHVSAIEAGPSPFAGGPAVAIIGRGGECGLAVTNLEAGTASWADPIRSYEGFSWQQPTDIFANYLQSVAGLIADLGVGGTVAIEEQAMPASLLPMLDGMETAPISDALTRQRMIKTPEEIALLREAALTASAGQRAFLDRTRAGIPELQLFADIRLAMEARAGERLPVTGDLISGKERTSAFMGWPNNRLIAAGDPVICDLAPRVQGYWGDSCASAMLGQPGAAYLRQFQTVKSALDLAIDVIRPGLMIGELDRQLQAHITQAGYGYAHHSGHSIGTSVHEWPRIVGYETETFQQDMVIMVEPTAFAPEIGGVRLEFMLHVTGSGCEVLTDFDHQPAI